jgi:probable HAF family extracellular repeat protein
LVIGSVVASTRSRRYHARSLRPFVPLVFRPRLAAALAIALLIGSSAPLRADTTLYRVTDLGSLGCCWSWIWESTATGINNNGDVVGYSTSPTDPAWTVPFIYRNGTMTAMTATAGFAHAINDAGDATGMIYTPEGLTHAFLYRNGVLTDIGTLPGEATLPQSVGYAINNAGMIVGQSTWDAMIYENGQMSILKRRTAHAAYGVNDAGDVVGRLENMSPLTHAFLFSSNNLIDLGTLDGDKNGSSVATDINSRGQVVGASYVNGNSQQRAFVYENGVMRDIGTLHGGYAAAGAINELGHIIGYSDGSVFLYRDGSMIDLNSVIEKDADGIWPYVSSVASINDRGQIVGNAYIRDAQGNVKIRACLLTPITTN